MVEKRWLPEDTVRCEMLPERAGCIRDKRSQVACGGTRALEKSARNGSRWHAGVAGGLEESARNGSRWHAEGATGSEESWKEKRRVPERHGPLVGAERDGREQVARRGPPKRRFSLATAAVALSRGAAAAW